MKKIDAVGIPVVHIGTVTPISISVGANRVVPGVSIPYPVGRQDLSLEKEKAYRMKMIETALMALQTDISEQTIFKVE